MKKKYFLYVAIGLLAYAGALMFNDAMSGLLRVICAFIVGFFISEGAMRLSTKSSIKSWYDNY